MNRAARLVASGALAAATAAGAVAPAADAQERVGWTEARFTDPRIEDGYDARGSSLVVPVLFEFRGPPGSRITDVTLVLTALSPVCDSRTYNEVVADGSAAPPTTTPTTTTPTTAPTTTPPTTAPADSSGTDTAYVTFSVDPNCNGLYDIDVTATAETPGSVTPDSTSPPVEADRARLSLAPPSPHGVVADSSGGTVTVGWEAPAAWTPSPAVDAVGYRIRRAQGTAPAVTLADVPPTATSFVDDSTAGVAPGRYRYEVLALRSGVDGDTLTSEPAVTEVDLGTVATTTASTSATGGLPAAPRVGGAGTGVVVAAPPPAAPATEFDPGFDPELDYSDAEVGAPEAEVPDDAGLFDVVSDDPVGAGILVPGAVALCLAVWAAHLRHLARRAEPPGS